MNDEPRSDSEQLILYAVIAIIGMIPIVVVVANGAAFGAEATMGLIMLGVATVGLVTMWRVARTVRFARRGDRKRAKRTTDRATSQGLALWPRGALPGTSAAIDGQDVNP